MSLSLRFAVLLVLVGCGGSAGDVPLADTFVGSKDAEAARDGGANSGDVGVSDPSSDAGTTGDDDARDANANDADAIDTGSPPIVDASSDPVDASPPVDGAPPVDSGPPCVTTNDKIACDFGGHTQGAYSSGIADDGCGSYYNCHAQTCGAHPNGPNDAGLPPTAQTTCMIGNVAGWEYSCILAPDLMPSACASVKPDVWCCPIPKNGQPFSEVLF